MAKWQYKDIAYKFDRESELLLRPGAYVADPHASPPAHSEVAYLFAEPLLRGTERDVRLGKATISALAILGHQLLNT
jgi:hypothetical protein